MTKVYRIENERGKGICSSGTGICKKYKATGAHSGCDCLTGWSIDAELIVEVCKHANGRYAFSSLADLEEWFPDKKGREAMKKEGAKISVFELPEEFVIADAKSKQCAFFAPEATKVSTLDIVTLETEKTND